MSDETVVTMSDSGPTIGPSDAFKTCEIVVNGFSIKDLIADSLRWRKGSTVDDDFIKKVSEEIRDIFKAKLHMRDANE